MGGATVSVSTEYPEIISEIFMQAKMLYDISPLSKSTLLSLKNTAELLVEDKRNGLYTILRISKQRNTSRQQIESEVAFLHELSTYNFPFIIPEILPGYDGKHIQQISLPDGSIYFCIMFSFLRGRPLIEINAGKKELCSNFTKLGEATALMHQCSILWGRSQTLPYRTWDFDSLIGLQPRCEPWYNKKIVEIENNKHLLTEEHCRLFDSAGSVIKSRLKKFGKSPARFGLIHSNLSMSNVFYYKNRLTITRFDNCGFCWFLYDYASSMSSLEDDPRFPELSAAWLEGYRRKRNISNEENAEMPTFIMLRRLSLISRLINNIDCATPDEYNEDFVEKSAALAEKYLLNFS